MSTHEMPTPEARVPVGPVRTHLSRVVGVALVPVGVAFVFALVMTTLLAVTLGDPFGSKGGPGDWLRTACLAVAASLRVWIFTSASFDDEGFSDDVFSSDDDTDFSFTGSSTSELFTPLILTTILLGLIAQGSRLAETRHPSRSLQDLLAATGVTAAVAWLGVLLLTLIPRWGGGSVFSLEQGFTDLGSSEVDVSAGAELPTLLGYGLTLLAVAALLGRLRAWVPQRYGHSLTEHLRQLTGGASDWAGLGALVTLLVGCLSTAVLYAPYVMQNVDADVDEAANPRLFAFGVALGLILLAPQYVLIIGGASMGLQVGLPGGFEGSSSYGIFSSGVPDRFALGVVITGLVVVVVGARRSLRVGPAESVGTEAARAAAGFVAVWVVLGFLLAVGAKSFGASVVFGPSALTMILVPAAWGIAAAVLGRVAAKALVSSAPALARGLARGVHPDWAPPAAAAPATH